MLRRNYLLPVLLFIITLGCSREQETEVFVPPDQETIDGLKKAYRIIWRQNRTLNEGIRQVREEVPPFPELEILISFLDGSKRGILR